MQAITLASNSKFKIVEQSDSINFLSWLLNTVHEYLLKKNKSKLNSLDVNHNKTNITKFSNHSIISETFQGKLLVETFQSIKETDKIGVNDKVVEIDEILYKYEAKEQTFL